MSDYAEQEVAELNQEKDRLERGLNETQREIRRLRGIAREYSQFRSRARFMQVELDIPGSARTIGDVMEEAWGRALDMDAQELSFVFNAHKITIKKEAE